MFIELFIVLILIFGLWAGLRYFTKVWIRRPLSAFESIISGIFAWLFVISLVLWGILLVLLFLRLIKVYNVEDLWSFLIAIFFTGYFTEFILSSRSELILDETIDFIKDALQFRRSAQHRITVLELLAQKRKERSKKRKTSVERLRIEQEIKIEEAIAEQVNNLSKGKTVSITEIWKQLNVKYISHDFYNFINEIRIDPVRKRLMVQLDLTIYDEISFKDELEEMKLYRQVYDFMVLLSEDPRLKQFRSYIENIYLLCRRSTYNTQKEKILYPFLKAGVRLEELKETIGSYFNPRKLPELAAIAFKKGLPV